MDLRIPRCYNGVDPEKWQTRRKPGTQSHGSKAIQWMHPFDGNDRQAAEDPELTYIDGAAKAWDLQAF